MPAALWPRASLLRRSLLLENPAGLLADLAAGWRGRRAGGVVAYSQAPSISQLSGGPRTALLLHMAESVLVHGDETTLRRILIDWSGREAPIFAVDEQTASCWGRKVEPEAIAAARRLATGKGDDARVAAFALSSEHTYVLFCLATNFTAHRPAALCRPCRR